MIMLAHVGRVELLFRLKVIGGALIYQTASLALCLGPRRVPLPQRFSPRVSAYEKSAGERDRLDVSVEVHLPCG